MNQDAVLERYGPVAFLSGADPLGIQETLQRIRHPFREGPMAEMNMQRFYGDEFGVSAVLDACHSMPAFAPARLVEWHGTGGSTTAKMLRGFAEYLDAPNPSTLLVLVCPGKPDGRLSLIKKARKSGWIHDHPDYGPEHLRRWLLGVLEGHQLQLDNEAVDLLVASVAGDRQLLKNELEKLVLFSDGEALTIDTVRSMVRSVLDDDVWRLADHLIRRARGKALALVEALEQDQVSGYQLIPALQYRFRVLAKVVDGHHRGLRGSHLAKAAGIRDWEVRKLTPLAKQWSPEAIGGALVALGRAESRIKGGWRASDTRTLQSRTVQALCVEICEL